MDHELNCTSPKRADGAVLLGAGWHLSCSTRALAPDQSVIGCKLTVQAVAPKAQPQDIPLTQVSQDAASVEYSTTEGIQVLLDKKSFVAKLNFDNGGVSECKEKAGF